MVSSSQRRSSRSVDDPVDGIPMKGVSPKWYAIGAVALLAIGGAALAFAAGGGDKQPDTQTTAAPAAAAAVDTREQAAEQRRHLEITQRSLERLKEAEVRSGEAADADTPPPAAAAARPAGAAAPAAVQAPAAAPAPAKAPTKQLDKLDSIGADIAKQLGE